MLLQCSKFIASRVRFVMSISGDDIFYIPVLVRFQSVSACPPGCVHSSIPLLQRSSQMSLEIATGITHAIMVVIQPVSARPGLRQLGHNSSSNIPSIDSVFSLFKRSRQKK
jgi:hypothetical protein